jgi:hypothetical protein
MAEEDWIELICAYVRLVPWYVMVHGDEGGWDWWAITRSHQDE